MMKIRRSKPKTTLKEERLGVDVSTNRYEGKKHH